MGSCCSIVEGGDSSSTFNADVSVCLQHHNDLRRSTWLDQRQPVSQPMRTSSTSAVVSGAAHTFARSVAADGRLATSRAVLQSSPSASLRIGLDSRGVFAPLGAGNVPGGDFGDLRRVSTTSSFLASPAAVAASFGVARSGSCSMNDDSHAGNPLDVDSRHLASGGSTSTATLDGACAASMASSTVPSVADPRLWSGVASMSTSFNTVGTVFEVAVSDLRRELAEQAPASRFHPLAIV